MSLLASRLKVSKIIFENINFEGLK